MTATRELSWTHNEVDGAVEVSIELEDEEEVYFTDQSPQFEITIENKTNYDLTERSSVAWVIAVGQGKPEPFVRDHTSNFTLPSGEKRSIKGTDEPLSLEGHGIVAIGRGYFPDVHHDDEKMRISASSTQKEKYEPLATFSVWDREHYEVIHDQPQRTQHLTLFASVGIVFFAVLQSGTALGHPILGLLGGLGIIAIYWYSGFLGKLLETLRETSN